MKANKIAKELMIVLLMFALAFTIVYAVVTVVSNTLQASWTLKDGENINLYWGTGGAPTELKRGRWNEGIYIGLKNTGDVPYDAVIGKFAIWTIGGDNLMGCIQLKYYVEAVKAQGSEVEGWNDMTSVLEWNPSTLRLEGYFGPETGFPVDVGYNVVTQYGILFENDAPLVSYSFEAWIEQYPT